MLARTNWLGEFFKHGVLLAGAIVVLDVVFRLRRARTSEF